MLVGTSNDQVATVAWASPVAARRRRALGAGMGDREAMGTV
jgi:hypothetical protein